MNMNISSCTICLDDTTEKCEENSSQGGGGKFKKCSSEEFDDLGSELDDKLMQSIPQIIISSEKSI